MGPYKLSTFHFTNLLWFAPHQSDVLFMKHPRPFLLSVVVPVYNESGNVKALLERLLPVLGEYHYELIVVDDGSTDDTATQFTKVCADNKSIKVISFTRNFGHQNALTAGYRVSKGDCVITIDADLQDPPELIHEMISQWLKGTEIIYARRRTRNSDSYFKRYTAWAFYWLINRLSDVPIPTDVGDYRLLDRKVIDYLKNLPERAIFLRGLVAWSGYSTAYVDFDRTNRHSGKTHYPFKKMVSFAVTGITAFSTKPLRVVMYFGFLTASLGFMGMAYAFFRRVFLPHEFWVTGWTTLIVAVMFFSGVQIVILGVIGEYIGRIFGQVQERPLYVVRKKINIEDNSPPT